jgi:prepilin peptidase CpaA
MLSLTGFAMTGILALATGALAWGAIVDVRRYIIPNVISATVAGSFLLMAAFMPPSFVIGGLLTGLAVLAVGVFIFARGWMGGGDVKLLAATCLWAGPSMLAPFALVTSMAAGALALVILSPIGRMMPIHPSVSISDARPMGRQPMPFGVAIAVGGLWVILQHFTAIR